MSLTVIEDHLEHPIVLIEQSWIGWLPDIVTIGPPVAVLDALEVAVRRAAEISAVPFVHLKDASTPCAFSAVYS